MEREVKVKYVCFCRPMFVTEEEEQEKKKKKKKKKKTHSAALLAVSCVGLPQLS